MGFFSDIKDKIFNRHHETTIAANETPAVTPVSAQPTTAQAAPAPVPPVAQNIPSTSAAPSPAPAAATPAAQIVDVAAILDDAVAKAGQPLNWRTSIVDLMKAVGIDSSLASRKELAKELDYTGDTNDSATMNVWLHKQVLNKLAANGGAVPAELLN